MKGIKRLCVYCGSSVGNNPIFAKTAETLGVLLAQRNITLVYGGAKVGLMGVIAQSVMQHGGEVIGVIPQFLVDVEVADTSITELHIVKTMQERKTLMSELSDGFVMLPGGIGSLEELFETWTLGQFGHHSKPCGILSIGNYYEHLLKFIDYAVESHFIKSAYRNMLLVDESPHHLLEKLIHYNAAIKPKWLGLKEQEFV
jgi:hypothetical protein